MVAPQSAQKNINLEILRNLQIPVPPSTLQQKFAHIVQKNERLRAQQREAERQAEHLFQTLLHQAFQGELTQEAASQDTREEEEARSMNEPDIPYPLTAPARLVVKETEQLALPMD
jgi:type I restriction enzyme, S subunit